jgi:hypothetical protein
MRVSGGPIVAITGKKQRGAENSTLIIDFLYSYLYQIPSEFYPVRMRFLLLVAARCPVDFFIVEG